MSYRILEVEGENKGHGVRHRPLLSPFGEWSGIAATTKEQDGSECRKSMILTTSPETLGSDVISSVGLR